MKGLKETLGDLSRLRSRFQRLLSSAQAKPPLAPRGATQLCEVSDFGSNPGNLRMFMHMRKDLPVSPPLVVALHGCTQTAAIYDHGSGWSDLADTCGFAVVFPEQQRINNPNSCFNWFLPGDTQRGAGEAQSLVQMINHMIERHGVDPQRVFIVGLSAGGAMASAMLAAYPDVFAGGAVIAGLPHGAAGNVQEALQTMASARRRSAAEWGGLVRAASQHRGPWPKLSLWHGSADSIVDRQNLEEALKQWTNVHGVSAAPQVEHGEGYSRRVWRTETGDELIEAITVDGMNHGVPIATTGPHRYGNAAAFHFDVGISSSHHIARFWGIADELAAPALEPASLSPTLLVAAHAGASGAAGKAEVPGVRDPRVHITAALEAAGLLSEPAANGSPHDPRRLIQQTLRSAGLLKH